MQDVINRNLWFQRLVLIVDGCPLFLTIVFGFSSFVGCIWGWFIIICSPIYHIFLSDVGQWRVYSDAAWVFSINDLNSFSSFVHKIYNITVFDTIYNTTVFDTRWNTTVSDTMCNRAYNCIRCNVKYNCNWYSIHLYLTQGAIQLYLIQYAIELYLIQNTTQLYLIQYTIQQYSINTQLK